MILHCTLFRLRLTALVISVATKDHLHYTLFGLRPIFLEFIPVLVVYLHYTLFRLRQTPGVPFLHRQHHLHYTLFRLRPA